MKRNYFYIFFIGFLLTSFLSVAQTQQELEEQRKKLTKEIAKVERILSKTKREKTSSLEDLADINKKISIRQKLIKNIQLQSVRIAREIKKNKKEIDNLNKQLISLKKDYADMIFKSYKSRSQQSKTMFLLSSSTFKQAYKRLNYMNQYTRFRKKQGSLIVEQQKEIEKKNGLLKIKKNKKDLLITEQKKEQETIEKEKKRQEEVVSKIKKNEKKYKNQLTKKLKQEKRIAERISEIIKKAIAKSKDEKKPSSKIKKNEFLLSVEAKKLATNFEKNKGKLPWPLKEGFVTRKFGIQPHPTLSGIKINSTGLHIETTENATAKSIFKGTVLAVYSSSEGRKSVMVQHGNYISAYNNLEKVFVTKGEKVELGKELGKVFTNKVTKKTKLVFVLFKNTKRLDPEKWML